MGRLLLAALIAVMTVGCVAWDGVYAGKCMPDAAPHLEGVDWEAAETIDIRIRQDEFAPMVLTLNQGRAYVLRLTNADDGTRHFRAAEFFESVAVAAVSVDGAETAPACPAGVRLAGGETAELRIVAVRDGRYPFDDSALPVLPALGASGAVAIRAP